MKITCPNNKDHNRFVVTAHVTESWLVDEGGLFVEAFDDDNEVVHRPDADDLYTCIDCDAEVKAEN